MAICKDCLHYERCKWVAQNIRAAGRTIEFDDDNIPAERYCEHFKNKADVVEVKHGYWMPVPSSDMSTGKAYKCSECDKMRYGCRLPPYCQECGAKMDGERKCDNG